MFASLFVNKDQFSFYKISQEQITAIAIDLRLRNRPALTKLADKADGLSPFWISKPEIQSSDRGYLINMLKLGDCKQFFLDRLEHIYVASCVYPQIISTTPFRCSNSMNFSYRFVRDSVYDRLEIVKQSPPPWDRASVYLVKDV